jgi:hypothetical protein
MISMPTVIQSGPKRFRFRLTVEPPWNRQSRPVGDGNWTVVVSQMVFPGDGSDVTSARSLAIDAWHNIAPDPGERAPNFVDDIVFVAIAGWNWRVRHTHHSNPVRRHGRAHWDKMRAIVTTTPGAVQGSFSLDIALIHGTTTDIFRSWLEEQGCLFPFFGALRDWWAMKQAKASGRVVVGRKPSAEPPPQERE